MTSQATFSTIDEKLVEYIRQKDYRGLQAMIAESTIDQKDCLGRTPLHIAVENGESELVDILLALPQVDIDSEDKYGRTPLFLATSKGHIRIVQQLLAKGANIKKVV